MRDRIEFLQNCIVLYEQTAEANWKYWGLLQEAALLISYENRCDHAVEYVKGLLFNVDRLDFQLFK